MDKYIFYIQEKQGSSHISYKFELSAQEFYKELTFRAKPGTTAVVGWAWRRLDIDYAVLRNCFLKIRFMCIAVRRTDGRLAISHEWRRAFQNPTAATGRKPMYPAVQQVHTNDNFTLAITFDDGVTGLLDMKPYLEFGVFSRLKDLDAFKHVRVVFGTIEWDCGVDLDPEFIRSKLSINTQSGKAA